MRVASFFGALAMSASVFFLSHQFRGFFPETVQVAILIGASPAPAPHGFVTSALAIWFGARRAWNDMVNTRIVFFMLFRYTKLFDRWWDIMPKWLLFLVVALAAILVLRVLRRPRGRGVPA